MLGLDHNRFELVRTRRFMRVKFLQKAFDSF